MTVEIDPRELPAVAENRLYLDYVSGAGAAADFYTHSPLDFTVGLESRRGCTYPRQEVSHILAEYNASLGADGSALANIDALKDPSTFCVIAGQQAGFLGGPAYTIYKIATTIRLAAYLQANLAGRMVPMFWLATEDHDFNEINHAYFLQRDGEVGRVRFEWDGIGRPVADLPITEDVRRAYDDYFESVQPGPYLDEVRMQFVPRDGEDYSTWQARLWSQLFSERGLIIVEPRILRRPASDFFRFSLRQAEEIQRRLEAVSKQLMSAGYAPALTSGEAGQLYTFDAQGHRVRVEDPEGHLDTAVDHSERYSTDAALRPLFADAMLPVVVSVLGPGETAYQAMLKPLYELFELPQPVLFPRKSYTVLSESEVERIAEYGTSVGAILKGGLDIDAAFRSLVPTSELEIFDSARGELEAALSPLRPYVESIDPNLGRTWERALASAVQEVNTLEERAVRARMSQRGFSKGELHRLRNVLLPRNRLQERVLPLAHFFNRYGVAFADEVLFAGDLEDFSHYVLVMEG